MPRRADVPPGVCTQRAPGTCAPRRDTVPGRTTVLVLPLALGRRDGPHSPSRLGGTDGISVAPGASPV
jgi:hypothetical protein